MSAEEKVEKKRPKKNFLTKPGKRERAEDVLARTTDGSFLLPPDGFSSVLPSKDVFGSTGKEKNPTSAEQKRDKKGLYLRPAAGGGIPELCVKKRGREQRPQK